MAASIAGVFWQPVRLIRECRGRCLPGGAAKSMFPGRYSEIFGLGERLGCILNLGHSYDAHSVSITLGIIFLPAHFAACKTPIGSAPPRR